MVTNILLAIIIFAVVIPILAYAGGFLLAPFFWLLGVIIDFVMEHKIISLIIVFILLMLSF